MWATARTLQSSNTTMTIGCGAIQHSVCADSVGMGPLCMGSLQVVLRRDV